MHRKARLIEGHIGKTLTKMTIPMILGLVSIVAFNLVDAFFVGKLGTDALAALSFTFPVVLLVGNMAHGIGIGVSSVISRVIGKGNIHMVQRLTTNSLILALLIVTGLVIAGLFTITPVFRALGATAETITLIRQYMRIWYPGMIFLVIPIVGNNAIRAAGNTLIPGIIMTSGALINAILDPILIFGWGPFPRMEIAGAALATLIARSGTMVITLFVLAIREKMLTFRLESFQSILNSWKQILFIGLPSTITRIIMPIGIGIITRIVSVYGTCAVAAVGVSARIEFFAMAAVVALSAVINPFTGQNWGAGKHQRVIDGLTIGKRFSCLWGVVAFIILFILAEPIAGLFNSNPAVISIIALYLRIVPLGYCLMGILMISVATLNVLHKPFHAALLMIIQMFVLCVPLAYLGSRLAGLPGVFIAIAAGNIISGIIANGVLGRVLARLIGTK